jgi:hypothetical protein
MIKEKVGTTMEINLSTYGLVGAVISFMVGIGFSIYFSKKNKIILMLISVIVIPDLIGSLLLLPVLFGKPMTEITEGVYEIQEITRKENGYLLSYEDLTSNKDIPISYIGENEWKPLGVVVNEVNVEKDTEGNTVEVKKNGICIIPNKVYLIVRTYNIGVTTDIYEVLTHNPEKVYTYKQS